MHETLLPASGALPPCVKCHLRGHLWFPFTWDMRVSQAEDKPKPTETPATLITWKEMKTAMQSKREAGRCFLCPPRSEAAICLGQPSQVSRPSPVPPLEPLHKHPGPTKGRAQVWREKKKSQPEVITKPFPFVSPGHYDPQFGVPPNFRFGHQDFTFQFYIMEIGSEDRSQSSMDYKFTDLGE